MMIKIGDKVKFLNEIGGGTVVKLLDKNTASVLTDDGFEIPWLISQLVVTDMDDNFFRTSKTESDVPVNMPAPKKIQPVIIEEEDEEDDEDDDEIYLKENDEINIYYAFVPTKPNDLANSDWEIYLVNDSNYFVYYNYMEKFETLFASNPGKLEPNIKENIITVKKDHLVGLKSIAFQLLLFKDSLHKLVEPINKEIKLHIPKFFNEKSYTTNDFFDEKAYILPIYEENQMAKAIEKLSKTEIVGSIKQKDEKKNKVRPVLKKPEKNQLIEVDLHIHELIDDETGLSPKEILDVQMDNFRTSIENAIKNPHVAKIVFIHGVGNGILKMEIKKELDTTYKKFKYQDASFKEYGYGATMVFLK